MRKIKSKNIKSIWDKNTNSLIKYLITINENILFMRKEDIHILRTNWKNQKEIAKSINQIQKNQVALRNLIITKCKTGGKK